MEKQRDLLRYTLRQIIPVTMRHGLLNAKAFPKRSCLMILGELITTKVAQEVESILGLDFGAFKRSVMLAQGEFRCVFEGKQ